MIDNDQLIYAMDIMHRSKLVCIFKTKRDVESNVKDVENENYFLLLLIIRASNRSRFFLPAGYRVKKITKPSKNRSGNRRF